MQAKTKITLIVLPFVLTACTFNPFGLFSKDAASEPLEVTETMENNSFTGSISSLFNKGKKTKCTFEYSDDSGFSTRGIVYVSGNSMRTDLESTENGITTDNHMIRDKGLNYIWSVSENFGMVAEDPEVSAEDTNYEAPELPDYGNGESKTKSADLDQEYNYKCSAWIPDKKKFEVPGDIEFVDMKAQMEELTKEVMDTVDVDCSVCDNIPEGEARTQCLAAINCN